VDESGGAEPEADAGPLALRTPDRDDQDDCGDEPDERRHITSRSASPWPPAPSPYSYLSASIGSSRDALNAGYMPKKMPTDAEKPRPIANDHHGSEIGNPDSACTSQPMPAPRPMPIRPPIDVRTAASITNWHRISPRPPPTPFR